MCHGVEKTGLWIPGDEAVVGAIKAGEGPRWLIRKRVKVFWEGNQTYFEADVLSYNEETNSHHIRYLIDGDESSELLWKVPTTANDDGNAVSTHGTVRSGMSYTGPVKTEVTSDTTKKRNIETANSSIINGTKIKQYHWYWLDEEKEDVKIKKKQKVEKDTSTAPVNGYDSISEAETKDFEAVYYERNELRNEVMSDRNKSVYPGETQEKVTMNSAMSLAVCERLLTKIHGSSSGTYIMASGDVWNRVYETCRSFYGVHIRKQNTSSMTIVTNGHSTDDTVPVCHRLIHKYTMYSSIIVNNKMQVTVYGRKSDVSEVCSIISDLRDAIRYAIIWHITTIICTVFLLLSTSYLPFVFRCHWVWLNL